MEFSRFYNVGCVHGRFQPFHLGHVNYLQEALKSWRKLVIGIAAPTPVKLNFPGVEHRNHPHANPLTYLERVILIRECCRALGIADEAVEFIPFPIDEPESLKYILSKDIVCATTRLYDWNEEKIRRLSAEGYMVQVLDKCVKVQFDGSAIRKLIVAGDESWKTMVLPAAANILESWNLRARLKILQLSQSSKN